MQTLASRDNRAVKEACRLRDSAAARKEQGLFFAEGLRLCADLAQTCPLRALYVTEAALAAHPQLAALDAQPVLVSGPVAQKLSDTRAPQGVFALLGLPPASGPLAAGERVLVLEQVQDPANVGALLRSAAAFGFGRVLLCAGCADPFSPKALRASMGAVGRLGLEWRRDTAGAVAELRALGIPVWAAALAGSVPLDEAAPAPGKGVAVVIGNEGNGLCAETVAAADGAVRIPMGGGVESLNAAVAGGVLLWHFRAEGGA